MRISFFHFLKQPYISLQCVTSPRPIVSWALSRKPTIIKERSCSNRNRLFSAVSEISRKDFFRRNQEILETLFSPDWFHQTSRQQHPAYQRWLLCEKIITKQGGAIHWPEQSADLPTLARLGLDSAILIDATKGDLRRLRLGSLDLLFRDENVRKKFLSRRDDPEQFEDVWVELYVGAWHRGKGHDVEHREIEKRPDIKIKIPGAQFPAFVECKRLRVISEKRIRRHIRDANNKISNETKVGPGYGILVLDVSAHHIAEAQDNEGIALPEKLKTTVSIVQSRLADRKNRSIGAAILVWDEYKVQHIRPSTEHAPLSKTWYGFRRRSTRVFHNNPHFPLPQDLPVYDVWKVEFTMHYTPRSVSEATDRMKWIPE